MHIRTLFQYGIIDGTYGFFYTGDPIHAVLESARDQRSIFLLDPHQHLLTLARFFQRLPFSYRSNLFFWFQRMSFEPAETKFRGVSDSDDVYTKLSVVAFG